MELKFSFSGSVECYWRGGITNIGIHRVLHVVNGLDYGGGVQTLLIRLFRRINRNRVSFDFVFERESNGFQDTVSDLGGRSILCDAFGKASLSQYKKSMKDLITRNGPYDILHTHTKLGVFAAQVANELGIQAVCHSHAYGFNHSLMSRLKLRYLNHLYSRCFSKRLAVSEEAGSYLFGNAKYEIIDNFLDPDFFNIPVNVPLIHKKPGSLLLGTIGRFSKEKNQIFLVELLRHLLVIGVDAYLCMIGTGPDKSRIERQVFSLGIAERVSFIPFTSDIKSYLKSFDVFLLPSLAEGFSLVGIEAQAAGTPCIFSTNVPRRIDFNLGITKYANLANKDEWVKAIQEYQDKRINDEVLLEKAVKRKGFTIEYFISKMEKVYGFALVEEK